MNPCPRVSPAAAGSALQFQPGTARPMGKFSESVNAHSMFASTNHFNLTTLPVAAEASAARQARTAAADSSGVITVGLRSSRTH
ncbi:MAG: hypothetical protein BWX48_01934 [Verrucomicrobia bacterium ADurb.Bin006]|nr:MAG: hypothetical protein BWX48_01934 [Verrucomicrobia bacterium ADurb.Bin006]